MLVPPDVRELHSPHLLLWRAYEHVDVLEATIARWIHGGGYRFDRHIDDDGVLHVILRLTELPAEWSLLIGEAVHGMRASLDHLIFALSTLAAARALTPEEASRCEFPIFGRRAPTDTEVEKRIGLLGDGLQALVLRMQPHNVNDYERHLLWLLHELDNHTKHRAIATTLVSYSAFMPVLSFEGNVQFVTPDSPLHDGLEVLSGTPVNHHRRQDVVAEMRVAFPWDDDLTPKHLQGQNVVDALRTIHGLVLDIHMTLIQNAGYGIAMPASNVPEGSRRS